MQQGMDRNVSQAMALAATQNGQNPSLAMRNVQDLNAQAQQQTINQAGIARAQEAQVAQGMYGQNLAQQQAGYLNIANQQAGLLGLDQQNQQFNAGQGNQYSQFNANLMQQANQYNSNMYNQNQQFNATQGNALNMYNAGQTNQGALTQAQLNQQTNSQNATMAANLQAQNNNLIQQNIALGMTKEDAEYAARVQIQQFNTQLMAQQEATRLNRGSQADASAVQGIGSALAAVGTVAAAAGTAASDKRLKKNIKKSDKDVKEFLKAIKAYTFEYEDEKWGKRTKNRNHGSRCREIKNRKGIRCEYSRGKDARWKQSLKWNIC